LWLILSLSLKVPLEVIIQAHLLLQLVGMVLKRELLSDILLLDPLDVVEEVFTAREDLSRIVKVHSNHIIA
jgi:hypothetical protein